MSKRFTKVYSALWRSARFNGLPGSDAKLAYLYLLTNDHQSSIGAYPLPDGYAMADLDWSLDRYHEARAALDEGGLIAFDANASTVYIRRWFVHSPPMNEKHAAGCQRLICELESVPIAEMVQADFDAAETVRKVVQIPISDSLRDRLTSGRR
jgi:hypothetical protein